MTATQSEAVSEAVVPRGIRWWVASLLSLVTLINLIDRSTIAVLAPVIMAHLGLSGLQFAAANLWFQGPYALSQAVSGKVFDRIVRNAGQLTRSYPI